MKNAKYVAALAGAALLALGPVALAAGVSTNTDVSTDVKATASTPLGGASIGASASVGASASASVGTSSALSSVSSTVSSALSSVSSSMLGSSGMTSASMSCDVSMSAVETGPIDTAALALVTDVTVLAVSDCSNLADLSGGSAIADITTNARVEAAIQAAGYTGAEVVGYTLDGTALTVYVRQ